MPRRLPLIASLALLPALAGCGNDGTPPPPDPPSQASLAAGFDQHLTKPVSPEQITALLQARHLS